MFALALVSCVLASGAFFMSLRQPPAPGAVTSSPPPATTPTSTEDTSTTKTKKGDSESESDSDEEKDSSKDDKKDIIDNAYKLIHQRYNRKDYKWEDFDPQKDAKTHEGVIFIVYHRHMEPNAVRPLERLIEVHSENLKDVLRGCLKHVDTVFDPKPLVLLRKSSLTQIDAQKLFNHETQLENQLAKLREQLKVAEAKEAQTPETQETPKKDEKKVEPVRDSSLKAPVPSVKALLNGDSADSDVTAVNTPDRSSTPKIDADAEKKEDPNAAETEVELTAEAIRLRVLHLEKLIRFLSNEFAPTRQKLNDLLVSGDIKFGLLWCLFRLGSVISFKDYESGLVMAGEITSADYMRRGDQQEYFEIHVRSIDYNGSCFYYAWQRL